jgi:hypothetical protein
MDVLIIAHFRIVRPFVALFATLLELLDLLTTIKVGLVIRVAILLVIRNANRIDLSVTLPRPLSLNSRLWMLGINLLLLSLMLPLWMRLIPLLMMPIPIRITIRIFNKTALYRPTTWFNHNTQSISSFTGNS